MHNREDFVAFLDVRFASFTNLYNETRDVAACEEPDQQKQSAALEMFLPSIPPTAPDNVR